MGKVKRKGKKKGTPMTKSKAKRLHQRDKKQSKAGVKVEVGLLRDNWNLKKTVIGNLKDLGLSYNPNKIPKIEAESLKHLKFMNNEKVKSVESTNTEEKKSTQFTEKLEEHAKSLKKKGGFRFSNEQVMFITYLLDKHKYNYKAMARDPRNHYQETPSQLKQKIRRFMNVPEQFAVYCRERGLLNASKETLDEAESESMST